MIEEFHCIHLSLCDSNVEDLKFGCTKIGLFFFSNCILKKQIKTEYRLKFGSSVNMQLVITLSEMKNHR